MDEREKMQRLHQLSVKGSPLTAEEQTALQNWYETLDREEDAILNDSQPVRDVEELRQNLAKATDQTAEISLEVKNLVSQNEKLRSENQALKKSLEARLLEKVA
jgi:hypothetical protein